MRLGKGNGNGVELKRSDVDRMKAVNGGTLLRAMAQVLRFQFFTVPG